MSKETTYEVLSLKGGEWQTDTIYSDREEAIEAARSLYADPHIEGAKVISEIYNNKTGGSKESTIFNTTTKIKAKKSAQEEKSSLSPIKRNTSPKKSANDTPRRDLIVAVKASVWLLLILIGGLGILYGFDEINKFFNKLN